MPECIVADRVRQPDRSKRRGQSMLEFAIVIIVALVLMFGILQAGLAVYAYSFVSYSARAAVRYAMVHGSRSDSPATASSVRSYVKDLAFALDTSYLTVTTTWNPDNNPGSTVTVHVSYVFKPPIPLIWTREVTMSSTAQGMVSN